MSPKEEKYCPECEEYYHKGKFCSECGAKLVEIPSQRQGQPAVLKSEGLFRFSTYIYISSGQY